MGMPKSHRRKLLPEEFLFKYFYEKMGKGGSLGKLSTYLTTLTAHPETGEPFYGYNPDTNLPYSSEAIRQAMWRWAVKNLDEARDIYAKFLLEGYGDILEDDEWIQVVNSQAKSCLKSTYPRFLREHPEYVIE